jgi:TRAP-type C4-dicarboxylate transport system substrate-binding protein
MKTMKKISAILTAFMLIILISFPFSVALAKEKPIELKVTSFNPPHIPPSKLIQEWGRTVEEKSGGQVKFNFYFAGSLVKMEDTFRAIQTGLADMGIWMIGAVHGLTPLNEYISLPFLGFKDLPTLYKVFKEMQSTSPELQAEFKGMKLVYAYTMPPHQIHTVNKPVRVPDDIRGMKIMADAHSTGFLAAVGATAVTKGPADWYMSMQKGLVEGQIVHFNVVRFFKLEELLGYHTRLGETGIRSAVIGWWVNNDTFEKLPSNVQRIIMDLQPQFEQRAFKDNMADLKVSVENARKAGHPIIELTPQELEPWMRLGEGLQQQWAEEMESKGKPGKAILTEAKRTIAKFNQE